MPCSWWPRLKDGILAKSTDLLKEATALAPDYYYYLPLPRELLAPEVGRAEDGDAANFAEQSADRIGGKRATFFISGLASELFAPVTSHEFHPHVMAAPAKRI